MIPYGQETIIGCDKMCEDQTANDRRVSHNLHVLGKYRTIVAHVSWLSNGIYANVGNSVAPAKPTNIYDRNWRTSDWDSFFAQCKSQSQPQTEARNVLYNHSGYLPVKWNESWWEYNYPVNNNKVVQVLQRA
jgi:hypothetical protein